MSTPNVENYALGRGSLYFDPWDPIANAYAGERHLGNAPEVSININVTFLDHFSSMAKLKAKDKTIISETSPMISFTLDELVADNWKLLVFGNSVDVTQTASTALSTVIATPIPGRSYPLGARNVGITKINHGAVTSGPFEVGEVITGGTSGATATVRLVVDTVADKYVLVTNVVGTFSNAETITGGTSAGTAVVSSKSFMSGIIVAKTTVGSTIYQQGVDFTVDANSGYVTFLASGSVTGSTTLYFGCAEVKYAKISAMSNLAQEGKVRFVSLNPEGGQWEIIAWRVRVKPAGETALIGDDWSTLQFEGDILSDAKNHPESPFMDLIVVDAA